MLHGVHVANCHRGKCQLTTRNQGDTDVDVTPEVVDGDAGEMVGENGNAHSGDASPEYPFHDSWSHNATLFE